VRTVLLASVMLSSAASAEELRVTSFGVYSDQDIANAEERADFAEIVLRRINNGEIGDYSTQTYAEALASWRQIMQDGQYPNGASCSDPLNAADALRLANPNMRGLGLEIRCKGGCRLEVEIDNKLRYIVPLPDDKRQWKSALRGEAFRPPEPRKGGRMFGVATAPKSTGFLRDVQTSGTWRGTIGDLDATFPADGEVLGACTKKPAPPLRDSRQVETVLSIGKDGRVSACDPSTDDRLPSSRQTCVCDALTEHYELPPGSDDRRISYRIAEVDAEPNTDRVALSVAGGGDPYSAFINLGSDLDASACTRFLGGMTTFTKVPAPLRVDANGRIIQTDVRWPAGTSDKLVKCVDKALLATKLACPLNGDTVLDAKLKIFPSG